jgi:hypothetical protein
MIKKSRLPRATSFEQEYIERFASRSVSDRLNEGQLEVVRTGGIPPLLRAYMNRASRTIGVMLGNSDLNLLRSLSRKLNQPPGKIIAKWTREKLRSQTR